MNAYRQDHLKSKQKNKNNAICLNLITLPTFDTVYLSYYFILYCIIFLLRYED